LIVFCYPALKNIIETKYNAVNTTHTIYFMIKSYPTKIQQLAKRLTNKDTTIATQLARRILLHASAYKTVASSCARTNKNFILLT